MGSTVSSVQVPDGASAQIAGVGDDHIQIDQWAVTAFVIQNVLCVPGLAVNLLSVSRLTVQGEPAPFHDEARLVQQNGVCFTLGLRKGGIFHLIGPPVVCSTEGC
jgi:hypothetical protein